MEQVLFGNEDIMTQYVRFRGAEPKTEPLLRRRGLLGSAQN
jgi:Zn-dependent oligopeptidase